MYSFDTPLDLTPIPGGFNWTVDSPFKFTADYLGQFTVQAGFVTDLGSIPRIFWNLIPPEGPAVTAYVAHDYLYATQPCTQKEADQALMGFMNVLGIGWFTRWTVYLNLRAFGFLAWNSDKKRKEAENGQSDTIPSN